MSDRFRDRGSTPLASTIPTTRKRPLCHGLAGLGENLACARSHFDFDAHAQRGAFNAAAWDCSFLKALVEMAMRFEFSEAERRYIFDSDLCLSEVGLKLSTRTSNADGKFVVVCSKSEGEEFLQTVVRELAYRGFRPSEDRLRALAGRLGVTNIV